MPIARDYRCRECGEMFEVRQPIDAEPTAECECGGTADRVYAATGFVLKGGGWHVTDYPKGGNA